VLCIGLCSSVFSPLFVGHCRLLGQEVGGLALVFSQVLCLIPHHHQWSEAVCPGLTGMHCCSDDNDACFLFHMVRQDFCRRFFGVPFSRFILLFAYASNVLLGLEVGGRSLGFAPVLYLTVHYPL